MTARLIHGLPSPRPSFAIPATVSFIAARSRRCEQSIRVRQGVVESEDVVEIDGIRVTALARTALDLARGRPLPESVVVLDAAKRSGAKTRCALPVGLL